MTSTPKPKPTRSKPPKTTIRLLPSVQAELQAAAKANGRSMNAELMARLHEGQVASLRRDVAELKAMVSEVLDLMRDKS